MIKKRKHNNRYGYIRKVKERYSDETDLEYEMRKTPPYKLPLFKPSDFVRYIPSIRILNMYFLKDDDDLIVDGTLFSMTLLLNNSSETASDLIERSKLKMKILLIASYLYVLNMAYNITNDDQVKNSFRLLSINYTRDNVNGFELLTLILNTHYNVTIANYLAQFLL